MIPEFKPLFRNSHLATVAGNFWPREIDLKRFPAQRQEYRVGPNIAVLAYEHQPSERSVGQIVCLHGLEGSSQAGYIASLSQAALSVGFGVHRLNMRSCGGTEHLSETLYHSGLTSDVLHVLEAIAAKHNSPLFLAGFSLGGNVALKLAGELGQSDLLGGVCAVSAPIDLALASKAIGKRSNSVYSRRFLSRLKARIRLKNGSAPDRYPLHGLEELNSIWAFDDRYTAPLFGFGTAAHYYATQSAVHYLERIRIPALVIAAQDDPLVPFEMYAHPALDTNSALTLIAPRYGGHLGFLSQRRPRFWLDEAILGWVQERVAVLTNARPAKLR